MVNVLLDELPTEWNGYQVNTWFQIGIQVFQVYEDDSISNFEKTDIIVGLLFGEEDYSIRAFPPPEELQECIMWFLNGWNHDNEPEEKEKRRLMDFDVDQWRIYSDFRQIYKINLNEADLHWWEFIGMLWNMPAKYSSFLEVIGHRTKKPDKTDSPQMVEAIKRAHRMYDLDQKEKKQKFSTEEESAIDDYDHMMAEMKKKSKQQCQEPNV